MIINPKIFKAYDVRGIYPEDINEGVVGEISKKCAHIFDGGTMIIAHDIRHGSASLARAAAEAIRDEAKIIGKDFKIEFVGQSSTPMFYYLVNALEASGGIMITASHNPKNYNGMKIADKKAILISGLHIKDIMNLQPA